MPQKGFNDLPDEVINFILQYVDPFTAISLERTSRRCRDIANQPLLWKSYCQSTYRYWDGTQRRRFKVVDPTFLDWKGLFSARVRSAQRTLRVLQDIIDNPLGRIDKINQIVKDGDYGVKNELLHAFEHAPQSLNHLSQKYWAHVALGRLQRLLAVQEWEKVSLYSDAPDSFETSLAAFDMFILHERRLGDMNDICDQLDSYSQSIRTDHPEIDQLSPRAKAILIAEYLLRKELVGISGERHYHSLDHMFLGVSLFSPLRNSIPLVAAVIYSAVCIRFDLRSRPCSFPFHVLSVVQPPEGLDLDGNADPNWASSANLLYMDPFRTSEPVPLASLEEQLNFISRSQGDFFTPTQRRAFLNPASPTEILIRNAQNIIRHSDYSPPPPSFPIAQLSAMYSALWCLVFVPVHEMLAHQHLGHLFQIFIEHFPHDLPLIESHVVPLPAIRGMHEDGIRRLVAEMRDTDNTPRQPKLRSDPSNHGVKYRVGQVFRHRMRGYLAVITGWDPCCVMAEQWIVMNQVGRLERGRHQPFYNVLVEDTSSRYVAEDNVILLSQAQLAELDAGGGGDDDDATTPEHPTDASGRRIGLADRFPIEIGRFFKRYDAEAGRFVSNVVDEFPED